MKLRDLTPSGDVKGGGGSQMSHPCSSHSERPTREPGSTAVALRDYFTLWLERLEVFYSRRFEDLDAKTTLALAAADKAVTKAETATEKRFEGVNEFRATLADQAARLLPREEALSKFENLQKDVNAISREIQDRREAEQDRQRSRQHDTRGWLIPLVVVGSISVINLVVNLVWLLKR